VAVTRRARGRTDFLILVPMIVSFLRESGLVLQLAATHSDTVLVRQVGEHARWFETFSAVLSALMSLAILGLAVAIIPAARNFRRTYGKVDALVGQVNGEVMPLLQKVKTLIDNVEHISGSVRGDVDLVKTSVAMAHEKLIEAVNVAEQRLNDFNALLEVAQDEAESVFVATASTVRGVRMGAASLHNEGDEEDADDAPLPASKELDDGYDDSDQRQAGTARPRVRKQRRGWA
jgi:hypothetical protein